MEVNKEISESLFQDKIKFFFAKNKYKIIILLIFIITIPIFYQIKILFDKKYNAEILSKYSLVLYEFNQNKNQNVLINNLIKLIQSKNETVSVLALNRIINIYSELDIEKKMIFENIYNLNNFKMNHQENIKIKESLLKFDTLSEAEILILFNKNFKYYEKLKLQILFDFFNSKKNFKKAEEFRNLLNNEK